MRKWPMLMALLEDRKNCFITILRCVTYIPSGNHDRYHDNHFRRTNKQLYHCSATDLMNNYDRCQRPFAKIEQTALLLSCDKPPENL